MKIIDFHSHAFPDAVAKKARDFLEEYYALPMFGDGTLAQLKTESHKANVTRLVVCSTATTPHQTQSINNWLSTCQKEDDFLICLGTLHPDYPDIQEEVERIIQLGLHGVKLHPDFQHTAIEDERMQRIYEACQGRLPILIHVGDPKTQYSNPRALAAMIEKFPEQCFIAAHMGGYSQWDEAMEYLIGNNVYIDTSSSFCGLTNKQMEEIIHAHDIDKVLFGTDYPLTCASEELQRFMTLDLTKAERQAILYDNAAKLLKLEEH